MTIHLNEGPNVTPEIRRAIRARAARLRRQRALKTAAAFVATAVAGVAIGMRVSDTGPSTQRIAVGKPVAVGEPGLAVTGTSTPTPTRANSVAPTPTATTGTWERVDSGPLATRDEGAGVWTGREILVVGGILVAQYAAIPDGAAYNPTTHAWRSIPPVPGGGRIVAGAWTGTEAVFVGNHDIQIPPNAQATIFVAYNPTTNTWRTLSAPPEPLGAFPTVFAIGDQIVVWGAVTPGGTPGAVYSPASGSWRMLSSPPGVLAIGRATRTTAGLAVTAVVTAGGGPPKLAVALLNRDLTTWRVSTAAPRQEDNPISIGWDGQKLIVNPQDPASAAQTYDPTSERWGETTAPTRSVTMGTGFATPVQLSDGHLVVRTADRANPLQIWNAATSTWIGSGDPPGPLPTAGSIVISAGNKVFLYGIQMGTGPYVNTTAPNAAWLWRPSG